MRDVYHKSFSHKSFIPTFDDPYGTNKTEEKGINRFVPAPDKIEYK